MQMSVAITIFLPTATSTATATFYGVGSFEWSGVQSNASMEQKTFGGISPRSFRCRKWSWSQFTQALTLQ